ncbi:MAG TPA: ATP-binding protein [Candidatus Onthousia faecigallinarum]|nr:ATP-binding protein [Candidatus Onthousia faecigallinarum]
MSLTEKGYKERLIDKKIDRYLDTFGAVLIEGPKWCGKTWTALNHAESAAYVTETSTKRLALINPKNIFSDKRPQLIDEWPIVPAIWDSVRHECDRGKGPGNFILTGSTTLRKDTTKKQIYHSGAGRIARLKMETMSLYESGDSTGEVAISDMLDNKDISKHIREIDLKQIAHLIIRGGWPESLKIKEENYSLIPKSYIDSILNVEIEEEKARDKNKMNMLLKSLARNESTIASNKTLIKDIEEYETGNDLLTSRTTLLDYLDFLERLHLIENQESYSSNYRSPERVGKSVKRHLVDPSLACSLLNLNVDRLMKDLNTFGFLFEALAERDLRIYMDYLDGKLYHFRDNVSGLEVDSILEFEDGEYAAVEIKLGYNEVDDAIKNLKEFYNNMSKKPKFMCVIVGVLEAAYKDPDTSIYIVPLTALRP